MEETYQAFLAHVAKARGRTKEEIHARAEGRVYSGTRALAAGLVDRVGELRGGLPPRAGAGEGASRQVRRRHLRRAGPGPLAAADPPELVRGPPLHTVPHCLVSQGREDGQATRRVGGSAQTSGPLVDALRKRMRSLSGNSVILTVGGRPPDHERRLHLPPLPPHFVHFVTALRERGVNVLGIGDAPV